MKGFQTFRAARSTLFSTTEGRVFIAVWCAVVVGSGLAFYNASMYVGLPLLAIAFAVLIRIAPVIDRHARRGERRGHL